MNVPSKRPALLLAVLVLILAAAVVVRHLRPSVDAVGPPTNVVLISIDTCRADHLGCYGGRQKATPNIDRVARDGVRFTRVHSTNPITLPAHSSMLTGTDPLFHGVHNNHNYRLGESNRTLAEILKAHGFQTAAFVSAVVLKARFGLGQGFDVYDDSTATSANAIDERRADATSRAAIQWLESHGRRPFFLFLHYFDPHFPYVPPEPFASRFSDSPYAGEIAYVDQCIGEVIRTLESMDLYDSTLLVITADHGESLGDHGEATHSFFVYESTIRVPLVIESPGGKRSREIDEPASILDIVPTVLGLLDLPAPGSLQGIDLSPWVEGRGRSAGRDLYCESLVPMQYGCSPLRGLIRGDWKLIWTTRPELYDLAQDPAEQDDQFAKRPDLAQAMVSALRKRLSDLTRSGIEDTLSLDSRSLERLRSLGYAGGAAAPPSPLTEPSGEDPKDFIEVLNRLLLANSLRSRGQLAQARQLCLEILEDRPDDLDSIQILGDVALLEGDFEGAIRRYSQYVTAMTDSTTGSRPPAVLRQDAELAEVHFNLGTALYRLQRFEEAARHYEQAIRLHDLAPAHNSLGALLAQQGRIPESIEHFRRALAIDPHLQSARENLALATAKLEQASPKR